MMSKVTFFAALVLLAAAVVADEPANLLVHKKIITHPDLENKVIQNRYILAQGQNFTVEYKLFNVGKGDAVDVSIQDNWPTDQNQFDVLDGSLSNKWDSIAAGESVTHRVVLTPKIEGGVNGFRAIVTYKTAAGAQPQIAYSTETPPHIVITETFFERVTAKFYAEKAIFGVLLLLVVGYPYSQMIAVQKQYKSIEKKNQ